MQELSFDQDSSFTKQNYRSSGISIKKGNIKKGVNSEPYKKLFTSSIPTKLENFVFKNENNKGFNSTTKRFNIQKFSATGPGSYINNGKIHNQIISKNGLGNGFVSKVQRNVFTSTGVNLGPGPGYYKNPEKISLIEQIHQKFEPKNTIVRFYKKKQRKIEKKITYQLGPGDYNPNRALNFQNTYASSFQTKYQRDDFRKFPDNPAPGQYENQKNIIDEKKYHQGEDWEFKKKSQKNMRPIQELMQYIQKSEQPIDEFKEIKEEKKQKQTWIFQEQLKDRFGDIGIVTNNQPLGPGTYPNQQFNSLEQKYKYKNYISSACFLSETVRNPYKNSKGTLGPNLINPYLAHKKKNFNLNLDKNWI